MQDNDETRQTTNITLGFACKWILGCISLLMGVLLLITKQEYIAGLCFLLISGLLLPPICNALLIKFKIAISSGFKVIIILVLFGIAVSTSTTENKTFKGANIETNKSHSKSDMLFASLLADDFEQALESNSTAITLSKWLDILPLEGIATANEILNSFEKNEVAAVKKFKGQWLITGQVQGIDDSIDNAIVKIGRRKYFMHFNAQFDNKDRAATYNIKDDIKIICERIQEVATFVYGRQCSDFNDWKIDSLKGLLLDIDLKDLPKMKLIEKAIYDNLEDSSPCLNDINNDGFVEINSDSCKSELTQIMNHPDFRKKIKTMIDAE